MTDARIAPLSAAVRLRLSGPGATRVAPPLQQSADAEADGRTAKTEMTPDDQPF